MKNINRLPEDEIFELMHNRYLEEMQECQYPMHVMDMYGYGPLCFLDNIVEEDIPSHKIEDEPPEMIRPCHTCGNEIEPTIAEHVSYCSLSCFQYDQI